MKNESVLTYTSSLPYGVQWEFFAFTSLLIVCTGSWYQTFVLQDFISCTLYLLTTSWCRDYYRLQGVLLYYFSGYPLERLTMWRQTGQPDIVWYVTMLECWLGKTFQKNWNYNYGIQWLRLKGVPNCLCHSVFNDQDVNIVPCLESDISQATALGGIWLPYKSNCKVGDCLSVVSGVWLLTDLK